MAELKGEAKARYVATMFARIARRYDLLNTVITGGQHHRWRSVATRLATVDLEGSALDVATGTGDFAFALARRPGISPVVGVDFVPEMVALARGKAKRRRGRGPVEFFHGDALALPFRDGSFACATSSFSLRNVADLPGAIAEMARVVRPGGRVVTLEMTPFEHNGLFPRLFRFYFHRLVPMLGGLIGRDREAYTYLPRSVSVFPKAGELARIMEGTGLKEVTYRKVGLGTMAIHVGVKV